ncbi:HNH endonuclease [Nostoc sp. DedQUE07]|uniref:HNH endonuclease n=1 Tax=Nostoc sp. DedQUE07 TaxID=3075392 RepID=UPI002AD5037D|nr:HNH endonuclease [Nostoc sp. DedQUE07]MDZ8131970.1 HNH endonuclease [Nostoc sp. DedQUE07]
MKLKTLFTTCNVQKLLESAKNAYNKCITCSTSLNAKALRGGTHIAQTDSPTKECLYKPLSTKDRRKKRPLLIAKYGMNCFWCGHSLTPETLTVDHYIPLSRGGSNRIENLRLACESCNQKRGNTMPEDTHQTIARRSRVRFPAHWGKPKYSFGQLVERGQIIGIEYQPPATRRACELGEGWHYTVLLNEQGYDVESFKESKIKPPTSEKINSKIDELKALIAFHQSSLMFLSKQLEDMEEL